MKIESKEYDKMSTNVTIIENGKDVEEMQGVYYYFLNDNLMHTLVSNGTSNNSEILGLSDTIQSLVYTPYMNTEHLNLDMIEFDTERYGWEKSSEGGSTEPFVYRITRYPTNKTLSVDQFLCYNAEKSIGGKRNWRNESRLYNFPFSFGILTDFIADPMQFKFHLCPKGNSQRPFVRTSLSNFGTYSYGILDYKGDTYGQLEAVINNKSLELPNSSSAYSNWASTSRAKTDVALSTGFFKSAFNVLSNTATGNLKGSVNEGFNIATNIANHLAMKRDLETTPKSMLSIGADVNFSKAISGSRKLQEKGGLYFLRYTMEEEILEKIGDFFAFYGYAINKIMQVNFRSRKYYNFIKTEGLNCSGRDVPKTHLNKFKEIFNNGITFWHVKNGEMFDYSKDNYEI